MSFFGGDSGQADWNQIEKLIKMMTDVNRYGQQGLFTDTGWDEDKNVQTTGLAPGMEQAFTQLMQRVSAPSRTYESPSQFSSLLDAKMANQMQRHNILDPNFQMPQNEFGMTSAEQKAARDEAYRKALEESYTYEPRGPSFPGGGSDDPFTTDSGDREGWDPTDRNQPDRYGPDGNLITRDTERVGQLSDFVTWGLQNNAFNSDRSFNDILNDYIPQAPEGTDPGWLEQFMVEHGEQLGKTAGTALGMGTGIQGLGSLGKLIASKFVNNYWKNNQWQSPVTPTDNNQGDVLDWDNILNDYMSNGFDPQQSGIGDRTTMGGDGNFFNPTDSQFVNDWNNRYGNTFNSNFDQFGNRVGYSGNMFGPGEGMRADQGGRPVGADGRAPDAGDLWVTFDYGN